MLDRIKKEPALVTGIILAVIGVASSFGLGITDGQKAAIVALAGAVLALLGSGVTRSQVTPAALVAVKRDPATGQFVSAKAHKAKPDGAAVTVDGAAEAAADAGTVLGQPEPDGKDHA